jgi:hypothetical protein
MEKNEVKWAWIVILAVDCVATVMFEHETVQYALGHLVAALAVGFIGSPIVYLLLKFTTKINWRWFHWFNIAASIVIALDVIRWIVVPMVTKG